MSLLKVCRQIDAGDMCREVVALRVVLEGEQWGIEGVKGGGGGGRRDGREGDSKVAVGPLHA
jgi:hypothetical protein